MKFPPPELKPLHHRDELGRVLNAMGLTGYGAEVGSLYGGYAKAILNHWKGRLICVDLWRNQPDAEYFDGANKLNMDEVYATFMRDIGNHPRCEHKRTTSAAASNEIDDGSLDFVFLDANHRLSAAREDIRLWFPKVRVGGIFSGHDFNTRYDHETDSDAQGAVMEFAECVGQWPQITWCSSWWYVKTQEMADKWAIAHPYVAPKPHSNAGVPLVAVLAVSRPDFHLAKKLLRWIGELAWAGAPQFPLVVFHTKALTESQVDELQHAAANIAPCAMLRTPPELYERGYAPSANYQFRTALELVEKEFPGHAMLWIEADCVPVLPAWFSVVTAEYQACAKPFLGDYVDHKTPHGNIAHCTGVAVYTPDWRIHAPSFADLPGPRPEQGWDSSCSHQTVPKMARSKTIQQIWRPPVITDRWAAEKIWPTTALFHQVKDGSLIDVLCDRAGIARIPLDEPIAKSTYPVTVRPTTPNHAPRVHIFVVTHAKDVDFLRYCLLSIKKYATGFTGVTVAVPIHELGAFAWAGKLAVIIPFDQPEGKGMMAHEIQKCRADEYCPDAEFVLHMDADCMMFRPTNPTAYIREGKALSVFEPYAIITNPNRHIWRKCVEAATGLVPDIDPMVRHPQVHPIGVYKATRQMVEDYTGKAFDEYVLGCRGEFPQGFAEFPTLSAVGAHLMPWLYEMEEYDHAADAKMVGQDAGSFQYAYKRASDHIVEWWSHSGVAAYKSNCEGILAGRVAEYYVK